MIRRWADMTEAQRTAHKASVNRWRMKTVAAKRARGECAEIGCRRKTDFYLCTPCRVYHAAACLRWKRRQTRSEAR